MSSITSIWIHGASLGDINALRALAQSLHLQGHRLTLSATTPSGLARWNSLIKEHFFPGTAHVHVRKAPLLSSWQAQISLQESQAQLLILELLEIWPAWIKSWAHAGVKVIVVDGRISQHTTKARFFLQSSFNHLSLFLAQTRLDAERAIYMGCPSPRVHICGDAKLDSILHEALPNTYADMRFELILGCIRPKDEKAIFAELSTYISQRPNDRILIAPRYLKRVPKLHKKAQKYGLSLSLYSEIDPIKDQQPRLMILDRYGALSTLYYSTHCAIIGGTFFDHGQNLIEAARAGCAVIYGHRLQHQRSQREWINTHGGYQVSSWKLAMQVAHQLQSKPKAEICVQFDQVIKHHSALMRQLNLIETLIFPPK